MKYGLSVRLGTQERAHYPDSLQMHSEWEGDLL